MCGIAGFSGDFNPGLLRTMNRCMEQRGPDASGSWFDEKAKVGLTHRRLSIIDLSPDANQPMWDVSGEAGIVFNGEIYNFRDLRQSLSQSGVTFRTTSDTEVLLKMYLHHGVGMLDTLNGMFAFAIWDRRDASLFIARDHLGIKPLYYAEASRGVVFGSTIRAVISEQTVGRQIDPIAVLDYLTLLYSPAPATMFQDVRKLEPGHALRIKDGAIVSHWQWYELPIACSKSSALPEENSKHLLDALALATERQMVADVPVGAFLSGGLDSSAIVSLARNRAAGRRLECFSIGFSENTEGEDGLENDLPYARIVAKWLDVPLHVVNTDPAVMAQSLPSMIEQLEEPQGDPAAFHVRCICRLAKERGVSVLLSGAGGDDLLGGYRRHAAVMNERYWSWLPAGIRSAASMGATTLSVTSPLGRRISKAFRNAHLPDDARLAAYFDWIDPLSRNHLLSSELRSQLRGKLTRIPLLASLQGLPEGMSPLDKMLYLEQRHFLADHNLNYTDKMSMAESVEVRVPFLDIDLLKLAWTIPDAQKYRAKQGKWILRQAMKELLPREILQRPKVGFGVPLRKWIHHDLRDYVETHLSERSIRDRGLFDVAGVRRLLTLDKLGRIDGAYTIFALLCIESWCRTFLRGPGMESVRAENVEAMGLRTWPPQNV